MWKTRSVIRGARAYAEAVSQTMSQPSAPAQLAVIGFAARREVSPARERVDTPDCLLSVRKGAVFPFGSPPGRTNGGCASGWVGATTTHPHRDDASRRRGGSETAVDAGSASGIRSTLG